MNKEEIEKIIETTINKSNKEYISLKEQFEELRNDYIELARSEDQLQNNWNELKKWAKERIKNANKCLNDHNENWDEDANGYVLARKFQLEETLNKMQELEGNNE